MSETVEILKSAKALLVEKGWTTGSYARDAEGYPVAATSPNATCYCALGAIFAITGASIPRKVAAGFLRQAAQRKGAPSVWGFNDRQGAVGPVLALFDDAIAIAEGRLVGGIPC